jgi:2-polyprenyl-6-methoxyphenol hydroxylase-like FAD-dependent oxidoreductase
MEVAIVGGGICGLSLALNLKERGIACRVYERAPEIRELGVGITLLPHAMREFSTLGLGDTLLKAGIENRDRAFFNRFGQLIYREDRGKFAGYPFPEVGIHRGRLHVILYEAVKKRLGSNAVITDCECVSVEQDAGGATVRFRQATTGKTRESVGADVVVACDGINSALRKQFYPNDRVAFSGINTWRGVTRRKPILGGRTYMRVGSIFTGKIVIYPIIDNVDDEGYQMINWMAEIKRDTTEQNDWNKPGNLADFFPLYESWRFDWLDVAQMIRDADQILEYPMVDKDPIDRWTFDRVTLAGDAAHPMYPRGSNGAAQAAIDARTLADLLKNISDPHESAESLRGGACRASRQSGAHESRAAAGFHQYQGRETGRRQAVRQSRQIHHARRIARAVGKLQAYRRLRPRGCGGAVNSNNAEHE